MEAHIVFMFKYRLLLISFSSPWIPAPQCITIAGRGKAPNKPCLKGKWTYRGKEYEGCSNPSNNAGGLWCPTEKPVGNWGWGYCDMEIEACNPPGETGFLELPTPSLIPLPWFLIAHIFWSFSYSLFFIPAILHISVLLNGTLATDWVKSCFHLQKHAWPSQGQLPMHPANFPGSMKMIPRYIMGALTQAGLGLEIGVQRS